MTHPPHHRRDLMRTDNSTIALDLAGRASAAATSRGDCTIPEPPWLKDTGQAAVDVDLDDGRYAHLLITVTGHEPA